MLVSIPVMSLLSHRRSYAEAIEGRRRVARRVGFFLLFFLCFEIVRSVFLTAYSAGSSLMSPTILPGELVVATPLSYGPKTVFGKIRLSSKPERGDIVVAEPPYAVDRGIWASTADTFVRFVTFQRLSAFGPGAGASGDGPLLLRVVALPGDSVLMEDFIYKVKPAGSGHYLTEFELSRRRYDLDKVDLPEGWEEGLPGSGRMEPRLLGPDEYFLDGDLRSAASGSRLWGPVSKDRLLGKVLLRYWPFGRFGAP